MLAAAWVVLAVAPGFAITRRTDLARKAYGRAVELQQKLKATPAGKRTAAEYERVIREYRNVYIYDFAYVKAPVAAQTIGDLYLEMGRQLRNPAYFNSAIKSYQYTAAQYPGTSMARESALATGSVYLESLNDPGQAAAAYRSFLEKYPNSSNSGEAKQKLKEIADAQAAQKREDSASNANTSPDNSSGGTETSSIGGNDASGAPAEVTDIHNWVGPNYTRVVIEARGPFQYTTIRLSHPDRIVFDLPNTRLSHDLMKKNVPINGTFLRDIRVGQFKPDVTRVVLDVKNINNFSAFPVPNPFRLIIDVHGTSPEMAENGPESAKSGPTAATEPGRVAQARVEKKTPAVMEAPASNHKPEVEAARKVAFPAPPKTGSAIEFDDQQAVMEKAVSTPKPGPEGATKLAPKPAPDRQAPQAVKPTNGTAPSAAQAEKIAKPEKDAASTTRRQAPPRPKAGTASDGPVQPEAELNTEASRDNSNVAGRKSEAALAARSSAAAKKRMEAASTDPGRDDAPFSTKPASPTINGSQTLTRALGLKVARIVIDPGHGGFDTGTIGPSGLEEKDLVLDIGLRLRKLLEAETNSEVFMTRSTDKFIPLEERTAIANEDGADLFISIHANASSDHHVRGIETYFLNFTSDPEALRLAARENATSQESVHQLQNLIQKIALNNKIEESQELARNIQTVLYKRMSRASRGLHNRGVRKAPFVVLIGANMPSILTEISFLSNPHSERLLKSSSYREQIAKALFNGIENYTSNLGSVRVAQSTR
ncbi:MAG: AMIN domain-containing protein [Acidobacteria bacterium]|nr:MAG: AMIN domain-containing protein [Acidobacteriota bacterium]